MFNVVSDTSLCGSFPGTFVVIVVSVRGIVVALFLACLHLLFFIDSVRDATSEAGLPPTSHGSTALAESSSSAAEFVAAPAFSWLHASRVRGRRVGDCESWLNPLRFLFVFGAGTTGSDVAARTDAIVVCDIGIAVAVVVTAEANSAVLSAAASASCFAASVGGSSSSVFDSASVSLRRFVDATTARTAAEVAVGARERASATPFVEPGRYEISNSYSCRVSDHLCRRPVRFGRVISHYNAAWSVMISNVLPYKYGLNNFTDQTTAKHSNSVIE